MTDDLTARLHARDQEERARVTRFAAERRAAKAEVRRCERLLVLAAYAGPLSQREVAAIAGVSRATLQAWRAR